MSDTEESLNSNQQNTVQPLGGTPGESVPTGGGSAVLDSEASGAQTTKSDWQKNIESQISDLNKDRISVITILGIFAAIFTFISVEIQILRFICDFYKILGFTLVMPGILLMFIALLDYVARSWINSGTKMSYKPIIIVIILGIALIVGGSFFTFKSGDDWQCNGKEIETTQTDVETRKTDVEINFPETIKLQLDNQK